MYIEVSKALSDKVMIFSSAESNDTALEFTPPFRDGLKSLQRAAKDPESNESISLAKRFIRDFGTHFFSTAYMGAKQVVETTFERMSKSEEEKKKRSDCINKAYKNGASKGIATKKVNLNVNAEVKGVGVGVDTELGGDGWSTSESSVVSILCYLKMMKDKLSQQRFCKSNFKNIHCNRCTGDFQVHFPLQRLENWVTY